MKKNEKMKKRKKTKKKKEKKWWKKRKMKKIGFTRKIIDDFHDFCFGMCLFPKENQQLVLGSNRFSEEKWQFSSDVKQTYTFFRRKSTEKNR